MGTNTSPADTPGHDILVWGPAAEGEPTSRGRLGRAGWVWTCECGEGCDGFPTEDAADNAADAHHELVWMVAP